MVTQHHEFEIRDGVLVSVDLILEVVEGDVTRDSELQIVECIVDRVVIDGEQWLFHMDWFYWLDGWMAEWIEDKKMENIYEAYSGGL